MSGQKLSFAYFQKCINPIFLAQLQSGGAGAAGTNTCASSGCHDNVNGTGGALRIVPGAQAVDLADPANTADVIRLSDMYKNFYSAQGSSIIGTPSQSRLLTKPLLRNVLHGGGLIFDNDSGSQRQADGVLDHAPGAARQRRVQRGQRPVHTARRRHRRVQHTMSAPKAAALRRPPPEGE